MLGFTVLIFYDDNDNSGSGSASGSAGGSGSNSNRNMYLVIFNTIKKLDNLHSLHYVGIQAVVMVQKNIHNV